MSRSYKKHAGVKDPANKEMKKFANKKVRHSNDVPNGKSYKKMFESYNISDFNWLYSWNECLATWEKSKKDMYNPYSHIKTKKELYRYWVTTYKRK